MNTLLIILTVLSTFLANLEQKTLKTDFVVSVSEEVAAPMNYPGTITLHGDRFVLRMFTIEAAYDGETMYLYSADTDELTLSRPSQAELMQANPFLYARTMANACDVTERKDGEQTVITLVPREPAEGIKRFVLRLRTSDLIPLSLEIKEQKQTTSLQLTNPMFITSEPKYVLEPEQTTFVNDMRL